MYNAPPPFNPWYGYYGPTPEPRSKSDIDEAIRALKKMRKFHDNEKKIEDEKKKKQQTKSAFSGIEMFFMLTLASPFIGIGYVYVLMFAMRQLQYMMR
jgi:hypothetical protein